MQNNKGEGIFTSETCNSCSVALKLNLSPVIPKEEEAAHIVRLTHQLLLSFPFSGLSGGSEGFQGRKAGSDTVLGRGLETGTASLPSYSLYPALFPGQPPDANSKDFI